jgi:hypothetical protein
MKYGKLRIAWSVAWGLLAVLLIVLWVRSYRWVTNIQVPDVFGRDYQLVLSQGTMSFSSGINDEFSSALIHHYHHLTNDYNYFSGHPEYKQFLFRAYAPRKSVWLIFPYWFAVTILLTLGSLPWYGGRFSLRTLLIATTLVAVGLGLIVYASKQ